MAASREERSVDVTWLALRQGLLLAERYRLEEQVGRGGMGVVWRARDTLIDQTVALKFLPETLARNTEVLDLVRDETRLLLSLTHEGIVRVLTIESAGVLAFMVMEFLEGPTLHEVLRKRSGSGGRGLDVDEVLWVLEQLVPPLEYAHAKGVTHLDIKPGNIMLARPVDGPLHRSGEALKLTDFGISFVATSTLTRMTGYTPSGTLPFMAPEILDGRAPSAAADVYGCAATLFTLITGRPPFTHGQIADQVRSQVPPSAGSGVASLDEAIACGLEKLPERRPSCVSDLLAIATPRPGEISTRGVTRPRSRAAFWIGAAAAAALATAWLIRPPGDLSAGDEQAVAQAAGPPSGEVRELQPPADEDEPPGATQHDSIPPRLSLEIHPSEGEMLVAGLPTDLQVRFSLPVARALIDDQELAIGSDGRSASARLRAPRGSEWRARWTAFQQDGSEVGGELRWLLESPWRDLGDRFSGAFEVDEARWISDGEASLPAEIRHVTTGLTFVFVPAGSFELGSAAVDLDRSRNEGPSRRVHVSSFYIAKTEVTCDQWRKGGGRSGSAPDPDLPMTEVSWEAAYAWCGDNDFELPTEAQWEYAASGSRNHKYPWGQAWNPALCVYRRSGKLMPTGALEGGQSWCGALDMAGNAAEWCLDAYVGGWSSVVDGARDPFTEGSGRIPRVARGGSYVDDARACRTSSRADVASDRGYGFIGFRPVVLP